MTALIAIIVFITVTAGIYLALSRDIFRCVIGLALLGAAAAFTLRGFEDPLTSARRRLDDHLRWWQESLLRQGSALEQHVLHRQCHGLGAQAHGLSRAQQRVQGRAVIRRHGDAEGDGDPTQRPAVEIEGPLLRNLANPLRPHPGLFERRAGQDHDELLTPVPAHDVVIAKRLPDGLGHGQFTLAVE